MKVKKLTAKQSCFVLEYLKDLNASQAALRAGYKTKNPDKIGNQLMGNARVTALIQAEMDARAERTKVTIDELLNEYRRIAFFDMRKMLDDEGALKAPHLWDDDSAHCVAGFEVEEIYDENSEGEKVNTGRIAKVKIVDKRGALSDVMKHLGGFSEDNKQKNNAASAVAAAAAIASAKTTEERTALVKLLLKS